LLVACGSSQYPGIDEPMPLPTEMERADAKAAAAANAKAPPSAPGTLRRADVESVVDAGLGRFLSHITVEPRVSAGKFSGWTIVGLEPPDMWQGVDLKPGDVVTRVNGMPIERETEAYDAFQAVRQAATLEVSYLRKNQPRTLRYTIVGAPSPALPKAPPAAPAGSAAGPG
jgi:S1-C subfamily serine protease